MIDGSAEEHHPALHWELNQLKVSEYKCLKYMYHRETRDEEHTIQEIDGKLVFVKGETFLV